MKPICFASIVLVLAGCTTPGVVHLSPDTYLISRTDEAGIFGNASKMKTDAIRDANSFAASQGKIAIPISSTFTPMVEVVAHNLASFDYEFRVVSKDDPEAKRTSLIPSPTLIETKETISSDVHTKNDTVSKPDLYSELTKLDDLRKKGIITNEEFGSEKKKLLAKSHAEPQG